VLQATHDAVLEILITFVTAKTSSIFFWPVDQRGQNLNITIPEPLPIYSGSFTMISPQSCYQLNNNASKNDTSPAFSTAQVAMASVDLLSKDDVSSYCMATTLQSRDLRSFRDSIRTSRFNSKVTGWFKNFESLHLPLLPSYHKQHSLFNDKFQSFWHCYWDFYWV